MQDRPLPFKDVASAISASKSGDDQAQAQVFDYSLWRNHGHDSLGERVVVPRWFAGYDYLSAAQAATSLTRGSGFPTLFCAAPGTASALHVDFLGTHFWTAQMSGRKRWRLVHPDDLCLLRPMYLCNGNMNPSFLTVPPELRVLTSGEEDLLEAAEDAPAPRIYEVVLEAGDVMFVPSGWPHQVSNVGAGEPSVAVSANFIDASNVSAAISQCEDLSLVEPSDSSGNSVLLAALRHVARAHEFERRGDLPPDVAGHVLEGRHVPLAEFKAALGEAAAPADKRRFFLSMAITGVSLLLLPLGTVIVHGLRMDKAAAAQLARDAADLQAQEPAQATPEQPPPPAVKEKPQTSMTV